MNRHSITPNKMYELARRKDMGIALIQRPLRFIAFKTNTLELDVKGVPQKVLSLEYQEAYDCAARGDGARVQSISRSVL